MQHWCAAWLCVADACLVRVPHFLDRHSALGEFEKAAADMNKVLQLDPANADAHFNRGQSASQRQSRVCSDEVVVRGSSKLGHLCACLQSALWS